MAGKIKTFFFFLSPTTSNFFFYTNRFLGHTYEFGPRDCALILNGLLQLLLIGYTIYQYLPSAPKGNK